MEEVDNGKLLWTKSVRYNLLSKRVNTHVASQEFSLAEDLVVGVEACFQLVHILLEGLGVHGDFAELPIGLE